MCIFECKIYIAHYRSETSSALDALVISKQVRLQIEKLKVWRKCLLSEVMSSKQTGKRRQTTVLHKWHVWHEEIQDGRDQQNAGDVVREVQKLGRHDTALTDNQMPFRVHTCKWHTDGVLSDHWRPTSEGRGAACTWDHGQTSECWWRVERQHSLPAESFLCCALRRTSQQAVGVLHDW